MRKSICIIDDDEIYQKIIQKLIARVAIFEESFYYIKAEKALNQFTSENRQLPAIILLDINMPVMDGWQFLKELEKNFPNLYHTTRVYIVTSSIAYSDKEKAKDFPGISGFLSKPMDVKKLGEIGNALK